MPLYLSRTWRAFKEAKPGERFRNAQRNRRRTRASRWSTVLAIVIGVVLTAAGILAIFTPGPGAFIIVLGLGLIARESAVVAKMMDTVELRLRAASRWCQRFWKRAGWPVRVLLMLLGAAIVAAAGWAAWLWWQSR